MCVAASFAVNSNAQIYDDNSVSYQDSVIVFKDYEFTQTSFLHHYKFWDNWYVTANVGVSHSMSENTRFGNFFKNERPSVKIGVGKWFYPSFGMRVTAAYNPQVGRAYYGLADLSHEFAGMKYKDPNQPNKFGNYDFSIFAAYVDGMINLTNVVMQYSETRRFNLIGIVGLGYNRNLSFDEDKLNTWRNGITLVDSKGKEQVFTYNVNTKKRNYFAAHVGLQAAYKVSEPWDVQFEVTFNGTDDAYNGKRFDRVYDTYFDVHLGATYHFKDSHGNHRFKYTIGNIMADYWKKEEDIRRAEDEADKARDAQVTTIQKINWGEALQTTIQFYIDRDYITDIQKKNIQWVANFMKEHPDVDIIVTGYADIQTAYPAYNLALSKRRATNVYNYLVKECGADASRLSIDYHGDQLQPGPVNEWNRAVVFIMKEHGKTVTNPYQQNEYK